MRDIEKDTRIAPPTGTPRPKPPSLDSSYKSKIAGPPRCSICNSIKEVWTRKFKQEGLLWICPNFCEFDYSEQTKTDMNDEAVRQTQNPDGNDRTDVVKASQLGFEVPEK